MPARASQSVAAPYPDRMATQYPEGLRGETAASGKAIGQGTGRHIAWEGFDDIADAGFWQFLNRERLNGTPLYFRPFLDRKPERCAAAVTALASASPGGVIFHCGAGRDRTGLVALVLLALADVEPGAIAADYEMSAEPVKALFTAMGLPDQGPGIEAALTERGTTASAAVLAALDGFNAETYLLAAGASPADLAAIRCRLLG